MGTKDIDKVFKTVNSNWAVIATILSGVATFGAFIIRGGMYVYTKAYYDFWNIPIEYLEMDNEMIIYKFIVMIVLLLITILFGNIYFEIIKVTFKRKKYLYVFIKIVAIPICIFGIFIIALLITGSSRKDIYEYLVETPFKIINYSILLSIMIFLIFLLSYLTVIMAKGLTKDITNSLKTTKSSCINFKRIFIGAVVVIFGCIIVYACVYSNRIADCQNGKEIEIVTIDDKKYAVIGKYEEQWIIKECKFKGTDVYINHEEYMIQDITSYPIRHYQNGINAKDSILSYDVFGKLK